MRRGEGANRFAPPRFMLLNPLSKLTIMFQHPHFQTLQKRIQAAPRRFIQVIYGPRQVGKTMLVRQLLRQLPFPSHYASADAVAAGQGVWISRSGSRPD